jgi:prepilin peptidase CpaA
MPDISLIRFALWAAAVVLLMVAALHDVALRIIPNTVPVLVGSLGLLLRAADGQFLVPILLAAAVFVLGAICWRRGLLGGGDVKLLAACALLLPPGSAAAFLLSTALAGGLLAIIYVALRRLPARLFTDMPGQTLAARIWRLERQRIRRGGPLPYACAICVGVVIAACGS